MEENTREAWAGLLNWGDNSARGFWILCDCGVCRQREIETRDFYFRAGHPEAGAVCCVCWGFVGSSFLRRGHPAKESWAHGAWHRALRAASPTPCWFWCFVRGRECSVVHVLLLWKVVAVAEASVRLASPWWNLQLLLQWWDCLKKRLKIILRYFCGSQTVPQTFYPSSDKVRQNSFH